MFTDTGFIVTEFKEDPFIDVDQIILKQEPPNEDVDGNFFFKMMIFISKEHSEYSRTYVKIPNILALVGRLTSAINTAYISTIKCLTSN